ncbi:hypothetical protein APX70_200478 [Pseudomonas syringae pv. maculicola]|uniref:Uncharacterized protein n=1 Tax=Pseudomonas syringae pv. maculicola TaxID=59511 RepID=A0A3M2UBM6_PSEYM|nr:hypothetical protein APX70_200478 [Pseudomonas syringae pv. maculicola]
MLSASRKAAGRVRCFITVSPDGFLITELSDVFAVRKFRIHRAQVQ